MSGAHLPLTLASLVLATGIWVLVFVGWMLDDTDSDPNLACLLLLIWALVVWAYLGFSLIVHYCDRRCRPAELVLTFFAFLAGAGVAGYATGHLPWWWNRMWADADAVYDGMRVKCSLLFGATVVSWVLVVMLLADWTALLCASRTRSRAELKNSLDFASDAASEHSAGYRDKPLPTIHIISPPRPAPSTALFPYRSLSPPLPPLPQEAKYGHHGDTIIVREPQPKPSPGSRSSRASHAARASEVASHVVQRVKDAYAHLLPGRRPSPASFVSAYPPTASVFSVASAYPPTVYDPPLQSLSLPVPPAPERPNYPLSLESHYPATYSSGSYPPTTTEGDTTSFEDWSPEEIMFPPVPWRAAREDEVRVEYNNYVPARAL